MNTENIVRYYHSAMDSIADPTNSFTNDALFIRLVTTSVKMQQMIDSYFTVKEKVRGNEILDEYGRLFKNESDIALAFPEKKAYTHLAQMFPEDAAISFTEILADPEKTLDDIEIARCKFLSKTATFL